MLKMLSKLRVPHKVVYGMLAGLYFGACLGLDKTTVSALVALGYALLAVERGGHSKAE